MKRKQSIAIAIAAVVLLGGFLVTMVSHKAGSNDQPSRSMSVASTDNIVIKNFMFAPATTRVKVGTMVSWTNQDTVRHTITADASSPDAPNSMDISRGESYSFRFTKAGTYTYHCFPHPYMHGTIIVTE